MRIILFTSLNLIGTVFAQANYDLPGCEARPEVARVIRTEIDSTKFVRLKWTEQQAVRERVLHDFMTQYPREIEPALRQIDNARFLNSPALITELRTRYRAQAEAHPDDPLALALAARALYEFDTPAAIRLAESARAKAPRFPFAAYLLALMYSEGLRANSEKFKQNLKAYFDLCPTTTDWYQMRLLARVKDPALQARVIPELRQRLEHETDPATLVRFRDLWALEFGAAPPTKHAELRKQIAADLQRL
jgi:hypothetical protein